MSIKWMDKFLKVAESNGLNYQILHLENGWIETLIISGKRCYTKSLLSKIAVHPKGFA